MLYLYIYLAFISRHSMAIRYAVFVGNILILTDQTQTEVSVSRNLYVETNLYRFICVFSQPPCPHIISYHIISYHIITTQSSSSEGQWMRVARRNSSPCSALGSILQSDNEYTALRFCRLFPFGTAFIINSSNKRSNERKRFGRGYFKRHCSNNEENRRSPPYY